MSEQMAVNGALADKTDIVWRLRANWSYLGREAADEITRLRAQVRQLNADYAEEHTEIEAMLDSLGIARPSTDSMPDCAELSQVMKDEITRLRNQVEQLRSEVVDAKRWAMQERSLRWAATTNSAEISRTLVGRGWISIRDQLPPLDERVLYVHEVEGVFCHEVNAGRWDGRRTLAAADGFPACVMDYGDEDGDWEPCTHWMPLPEPPPNRAMHNTSGGTIP